ncbi:hypothetical protein [Ferrovibrio sp.]|uniref:hypothetical protein n=1 Tax=Ferrovibrio sp. TaxID=1917215 RepID=UPI00311DA913
MPLKAKLKKAVSKKEAWEYTPDVIMALGATTLGTHDDTDLQTFSITMLNYVKGFEPGADTQARHEKEELKSAFSFCQGAFNRGGRMRTLALPKFYAAAQKAKGWTGTGVRQ